MASDDVFLEEQKVNAIRRWFWQNGFNPDNVDEASESNGTRTYPHSFRELWYSNCACTPLFEGAACGQLDVVLYCVRLSSGCVTWRDEFRNTALHVAIERGHVDVAKRLLWLVSRVDNDALSFAKSRNAMGATPAMLSTRTPGDTCRWCVAAGLFDSDWPAPSPKSLDSFARDNFRALDSAAIEIALADAPSELRFSLTTWAQSAATDLAAVESASFLLFFFSPLAGLRAELEPLLRHFITSYTPLESCRIRAFTAKLRDLGYYSSRKRAVRRPASRRPRSTAGGDLHPVLFSR